MPQQILVVYLTKPKISDNFEKSQFYQFLRYQIKLCTKRSALISAITHFLVFYSTIKIRDIRIILVADFYAVPFSPPKSRFLAFFFFVFCLKIWKVCNWDRDFWFPPSFLENQCHFNSVFSRHLPPPTFLKNPKNLQNVPFSPPLLYIFNFLGVFKAIY